MIKNLLIFSFLLSGFSSISQEIRTPVFGVIKPGSISVENIHVINKTTQKGTLSNQFGEFSIPVKENDTLLFSGIQFQKKELVITDRHLKGMVLTIFLKPAINQLEEILLKGHDLTGNLFLDIDNTQLERYADEFTLDLPNAGKPLPDEIGRINIRLNQYSGIVGSLYGWISGKKKG